MMKLGTGLDFSVNLDMTDAEKYETMAKLGFHSADFSLMRSYKDPLWQLSDDELKEQMSYIRKIANENGIVIGQTHAPDDMLGGNQRGDKKMRLHAVIQAIKASSFLGAPYIVIHPIIFAYKSDKKLYEEAKQMNMEFFSSLIPYLEKYNIKVAIENLFSYNPVLRRHCRSTCSTAEDVIDYIETLNSDRFVACLDTGHANLAGQDPVEMIYKLGNKHLHVTHIHDNYFTIDAHMMPGMGNIDWISIAKALHDIQFEGVFNYEAGRPFYRLGEWRKELSLTMLKVYAEFGKAMTNVERKERG